MVPRMRPILDTPRGRPWLLLLAASLTIAACAPSEESAPDPDPDRIDGEASGEGGGAQDNPNLPQRFAGTAWRVLAEDGARFVTYLDPDGAYRDLRNGDPWQTGVWAYAAGPEGGELCFTPENEYARESCWRPERMRGDSLFARGPGDRRIELIRIDYTRPEPAEQATGEE